MYIPLKPMAMKINAIPKTNGITINTKKMNKAFVLKWAKIELNWKKKENQIAHLS